MESGSLPSPLRGGAWGGSRRPRPVSDASGVAPGEIAPKPATPFSAGSPSGPTPNPSPQGGGEAARLDLLLIAGMVEPGSRVLDIGCGDGTLLALLRENRGVDGRGIELSREGVSACLAKGLPVIQGDADTDLADYPDDAFDYVILSQTIQATRRPRVVLEHLLRIGRRAIVSFPNFGHWRVRGELAFRGRMPVTDNLPEAWYDTPNIHFCTIRDFVALCRLLGARTERAAALDAWGRPVRVTMPWWVWNLFGEQAVFLLRRGERGG
jgi:methionine biosynthesis protein MetW